MSQEVRRVNDLGDLTTHDRTLEQIGLEAAARKFEAGGIMVAFERADDPEFYYQWMMEAQHEPR